MAILLFSKMAAVRHLGFVMWVIGPPTKGVLVVFIAVQNLVGINAVDLIICVFFNFTSLAWKRLFTPPKMGFLGIWPPNWGPISLRPRRGTNGCRNTSYEPLSVKIALKMWPVGVMKNGWIDRSIDGYVNKKTHAKPRFFTHAQSGNGWIDFNQILHIDSLGGYIWSGIQIGPRVWEGEGFEISPIPLTLPLASNTAYCATAHTRDKRHFIARALFDYV